MMASPILYVLLLLFLPLASGHAILTSPTPRAGTNIGTGVKLQPFSEAATLANQGCGGSANSDPGVTHQTTPPTVFTPGQGINVQWTLTIQSRDLSDLLRGRADLARAVLRGFYDTFSKRLVQIIERVAPRTPNARACC